MAISRDAVVGSLCVRSPDDLRAVLELARVPLRRATTPRELAARIATALWRSYATPLGLAVRTITLDEIVDHVAERLAVTGAVTGEDAWGRLHALTGLLVDASRGVALEDLDARTRARLERSWWGVAGLGVGAGGSFSALAAGRGVLWVAGTRVGRLLPYVPTVGPWVRRAYRAGGVAAALGGPVGVAMSVLAVNQALGTNHARLVPLLLGVGSLGPSPVVDAVEVV